MAMLSNVDLISSALGHPWRADMAVLYQYDTHDPLLVTTLEKSYFCMVQCLTCTQKDFKKKYLLLFQAVCFSY